MGADGQQNDSKAAFGEVKALLGNPTAFFNPLNLINGPMAQEAVTRYIVFEKPSSSYIWEGLLTVEGMGKLGFSQRS